MIRYRLICGQDHEFEAWFNDSTAYDKQVKRRQVSCPHCGDIDVAKTVMAPGINTSGNIDMFAEARAHEVAHRILAAVGKLKEKVEKEFDYVGEDFADEARAIHYGDAEERGIYGEATEDEAEELEEEGIEFFRLPGTTARRDN
ncbi:MAG: DUF1178 family protein [Rhodospirillaceae bacterium]